MGPAKRHDAENQPPTASNLEKPEPVAIASPTETLATIRLYGAIRHIVRQSRVEIPVPRNATVRQALRLLAERFGPAFAQMVLRSDGRLQTYVRAYLDDVDIEDEQLDAPLISEEGTVRELSVFVIMAQEGG